MRLDTRREMFQLEKLSQLDHFSYLKQHKCDNHLHLVMEF